MEIPIDVMDRHPHHHGWPNSHRHAGNDLPQQAAGAEWHHAPEVPPRLAAEIAARMVKANFEHLHHAWTRRWSDPITPQAIFYLYADPALHLAYRTFPAADEARLPYLLYDLIPHVRAQVAAGHDIRDVQCTFVEDMHPTAAYVGVAVSSLDTPAGNWATVWHAARSELHIPGRSYVWLIDDTVMVIDRFAHDEFGRVMIHTNQSRIHTAMTGFPVTVVPELGIPEMQTVADAPVLIYLRELNATVVTAGAHHSPGGGRHAY
jgi:hypothetical protein